MAEVKTKLNDASVSDFLNKIADPQVREDCWTVVKIMKSAADAEPRMWGSAIIGFGEYIMTYPNGREMPWMVTGFSPRKQNITLYTGSSFPEHDELLAQLGTHSCGKGCLYIKRLSDIHLPTLTKLVNASVRHKLSGQGAAMPAVKSAKKASAKSPAKKKSAAKKTSSSRPAKGKSAKTKSTRKQSASNRAKRR